MRPHSLAIRTHNRHCKEESGLTIIGFRSNDFMGQEPGTDEEIADFCSINYAVSFPLMSKISVVGESQHPMYKELTERHPTADGKEGFRASLRESGLAPTGDPMSCGTSRSS